jgi:hypothetical protein
MLAPSIFNSKYCEHAALRKIYKIAMFFAMWQLLCTSKKVEGRRWEMPKDYSISSGQILKELSHEIEMGSLWYGWKEPHLL